MCGICGGCPTADSFQQTASRESTTTEDVRAMIAAANKNFPVGVLMAAWLKKPGLDWDLPVHKNFAGQQKKSIPKSQSFSFFCLPSRGGGGCGRGWQNKGIKPHPPGRDGERRWNFLDIWRNCFILVRLSSF
jgi:hypothetical protein